MAMKFDDSTFRDWEIGGLILHDMRCGSLEIEKSRESRPKTKTGGGCFEFRASRASLLPGACACACVHCGDGESEADGEARDAA